MDAINELKQRGIQRLRYYFDGSGDSGSIESITLLRADGEEVRLEDPALEHELDELGYEVLDRCDVYFDDEGCFGEIEIDLISGAIEVENNVRYIDYSTEKHRFSLKEVL
ncbi:MAG: hypothetical protein KatS3mg071_1733 [Meiothermus sp.]|nr:MAG: hypothetical protein KatS3mg071_1733 [Meiothermus sp.]